ncbi:hypothetical protein PAAG_04344, partial [Paracoccidioides lutzii Pb01]
TDSAIAIEILLCLAQVLVYPTASEQLKVFRRIQREEGTDFFEDDNESQSHNWDFFAMFTLQYLRPPNVIELILLWAWNRSWPSNRPYYLRQLGHSDSGEGIVLVKDVGLSPDVWFSIARIEADALKRVRDLGGSSHNNVTSTWEKY